MEIYKVGPCGGYHGNGKDITDIKGMITRINRISVGYSTNCIDSISVSYQLSTGAESTVTWGGQAEQTKEFSLKSSEWITSVKGSYTEGLTYLLFETSSGLKYKVGKEVGAPFELPNTEGKIIGFHGRAEDHLNALGVYIKFDDATRVGGSTGGSTRTA